MDLKSIFDDPDILDFDKWRPNNIINDDVETRAMVEYAKEYIGLQGQSSVYEKKEVLRHRIPRDSLVWWILKLRQMPILVRHLILYYFRRADYDFFAYKRRIIRRSDERGYTRITRYGDVLRNVTVRDPEKVFDRVFMEIGGGSAFEFTYTDGKWDLQSAFCPPYDSLPIVSLMYHEAKIVIRGATPQATDIEYDTLFVMDRAARMSIAYNAYEGEMENNMWLAKAGMFAVRYLR